MTREPLSIMVDRNFVTQRSDVLPVSRHPMTVEDGESRESRIPHFVTRKSKASRLTTLLLGHTDGPASPARRLGVLAADAQAPVVAQAAVGADLLEALEIVAQLGVDAVGQDLEVLAVHDVALSVEEPRRDLVLRRVLDDGYDPLELFRRELTSAGFIPTLVPSRSTLVCLETPCSYRLFRSTSAFLQTRLEYRRPTPLILVKAYMTFCFPSTLVLRSRKIYGGGRPSVSFSSPAIRSHANDDNCDEIIPRAEN